MPPTQFVVKRVDNGEFLRSGIGEPKWTPIAEEAEVANAKAVADGFAAWLKIRHGVEVRVHPFDGVPRRGRWHVVHIESGEDLGNWEAAEPYDAVRRATGNYDEVGVILMDDWRVTRVE